MRLTLLTAPMLLLLSCDSSSSGGSHTSPQDKRKMTVVFQTPTDADETVRMLWQRSYPKEYSDLLRRAKESRDGTDPFADPIDIPDTELTPGTFGLLGWGRAIVPRVFDELGYPLKDGAEASYEAASGRFKITHSSPAIESFRARFPEFKQIQSEQAGTGQPVTRPESDSEGGDKPQPEAEGRFR
jgi:hypothetical protein